MLRILATFLFFLMIHDCPAQLLETLLRADSNLVVKKVMANPEKFRLQIILTELNDSQKANRNAPFTQHEFRTSTDEYFFPASMVKMPVSAFAFEKINSLKVFGISPETPFLPLSDFQCRGSKFNPANSKPQSAIELIKKIFVYSDNEAYNYLYELCGQAYIQQRLSEMGFQNARIVEKIATCNGESNRQTGPIAFYNEQDLFYIEGRQTNQVLVKNGALDARIGKGYLWNGKLVPSPKDFTFANFVPLVYLHQMMVAIQMPEYVPVNKRFALSGSDLEIVRTAMATLPSQYFRDSLAKPKFPDNYVKYLFGQKDTIPKHFRISNKVGLAHGFMSDISYFEDRQNNIRFFLSAVVYVNEDGILNDGKYEYYNIGMPFLRRLGEIIYQYEKKKRFP